MDQGFGFQGQGLGDLFSDPSQNAHRPQDGQFQNYTPQASNQGLGGVQLPSQTGILLDATQTANLGNFGWIGGGTGAASAPIQQTSSVGNQQDQGQFLRYQPLEAQIAQLGQAAGAQSTQKQNSMINLQSSNTVGNMSNNNVGQAGQTAFNRLQLPVMGQLHNQQGQEPHGNTNVVDTGAPQNQGSKPAKPASASQKKPQTGHLTQTAIVPRHKASGGRTSRKPIVLDREMLEPYFNVTQHTAAAKLGICQSALKKACRRLGIMKWPFSDKDIPREPTANPLLAELNKNSNQNNNNSMDHQQALGGGANAIHQNFNNGIGGANQAGGMDLQGLGRFPGATNLLGNAQLMKPTSMPLNQGAAANNLMQGNLNTGLINNPLQQAMTGATNNLGQQNFNMVNNSSIGVRNQMQQANQLNSNLNTTANLSWDSSQNAAKLQSTQGLGSQALGNQGLGNWGQTQADNFGLGNYIGQQGLPQQGDLNLALAGLGAQGLGQGFPYHDPK